MRDSAEQKKIAALIAAAPDMLAALQMTLARLEMFDGASFGAEADQLGEIVRAAIAKSEGAAP